ncbi:MAG: hydrogenase 4 subunit F [Thermoplasmata archaeon]|nr:hydrogenase 4 subunit F [Thermoplasmata archaeon]
MNLSDPLLWLLIVLLAPVTGALLAVVAGARASELIARITALLTLAAAAALLGLRAQGSWGAYIGLDALSDLFLFLVAAIYAASTWYSRGYLRSIDRPFLTPQRYYALLGAFAFAMLLTLSVTDLGLMWIGLEGTTVASALLIVLERRPTSVEAAWRYTLIASAGLTIALFALLLLYEATGSLNGFALAAHPMVLSLPLAMAVTLALVGYGTKIGLFPMHTWLPDAHSEAPSPVSAMFSGVLLPTALYAFLRVYAVVASPVPAALSDLVIVFGVATALVAAFLMQRQRSYKRLLAYSSMEVMGLAVVGVGLGGIALYGALILVVAHAFAKSAAFYCAGNVLRRTGTTRIEDVRGLRTDLPWTGATWVLSAIAVTGTPPFGTFVGELLIVAGAIVVGAWWVAIACVVAILLSFLGMNAQIGRMVFGADPGRGSDTAGPPESPRAVVIPLINVSVALLLGIIAIPYLAPTIHSAASLLGGGVP